MTRAPHWPEQLAAFIEQRRDMAFAWGDNDCALFAADWVLEVTGRDLARDFRATYVNARGAKDALRMYDGLASIVDATGLVRWQAPAMAQRGDVALILNAGREALGVVVGAEVAGPARHGVAFVPLATALVAWKV